MTANSHSWIHFREALERWGWMRGSAPIGCMSAVGKQHHTDDDLLGVIADCTRVNIIIIIIGDESRTIQNAARALFYVVQRCTYYQGLGLLIRRPMHDGEVRTIPPPPPRVVTSGPHIVDESDSTKAPIHRRIQE